jgi:hypothetical protein
MAQPKPRAKPVRPAPSKDLKPWQLGVFIVLGLIIAGVFVGVGFAKKSHDEYGQYPWSRTAVPPQMYYAHSHYKAAGAGTLTGMVQVGKTPGGGLIYAPNTTKKPAPTTIEVKASSSATAVFAFTLIPTP